MGDVNGISLEILLKAHDEIKKIVNPVYLIDLEVLDFASKMLSFKFPNDLETFSIKKFCSQNTLDKIESNELITPSLVSKESGEYSFVSFEKGVDLVCRNMADSILTLPINKFAWSKAGIEFIGHTEYLSKRFGKKGIMMLGCKEMFVALFSDHIPLSEVNKGITFNALVDFLLDFKNSFTFNNALVLGLNPHAGDSGILGSEDFIINEAINFVNKRLGSEIFIGSISPDIAFSPRNRSKFNVFIAMYHDQGLIPLKALHFDKSINVTLGLPLLRASVDHGTAFDIAYKNKDPNLQSYIEAARFLADS